MNFFIRNCYTKVVGLTAEMRKNISDWTAYWAAGHKFSEKYREGLWDGKIRLFKYETFPTGLLPIVLKKFQKIGQEYTALDLRKVPEKRTARARSDKVI